jgi:hypothetical protein
MSDVLKVIQNNYNKNFPAEAPTKAAQGFVVTASYKLAFGASFNEALKSGAVAATATIIEAVTRPITKEIFSKNPEIGATIQSVVPRIITAGLTCSIASRFDVSFKEISFKNTSFGLLLASLSLNGVPSEFYKRNIGLVITF